MAQWNGQYTGNSHLTKVEDLEATLRHAVTIFREASSSAESDTKGKAVRKLAEKLLSARLKFLRAKLYDAEPVLEKDTKKQIWKKIQRSKVATLNLCGNEKLKFALME